MLFESFLFVFIKNNVYTVKMILRGQSVKIRKLVEVVQNSDFIIFCVFAYLRLFA